MARSLTTLFIFTRRLFTVVTMMEQHTGIKWNIDNFDFFAFKGSIDAFCALMNVSVETDLWFMATWIPQTSSTGFKGQPYNTDNSPVVTLFFFLFLFFGIASRIYLIDGGPPAWKVVHVSLMIFASHTIITHRRTLAPPHQHAIPQWKRAQCESTSLLWWMTSFAQQYDLTVKKKKHKKTTRVCSEGHIWEKIMQ